MAAAVPGSTRGECRARRRHRVQARQRMATMPKDHRTTGFKLSPENKRDKVRTGKHGEHAIVTAWNSVVKVQTAFNRQ